MPLLWAVNANSISEKAILPAVVSLVVWLQQIGVTACTAWRWRKKGWLKTVNIAGRQYLTQEGITEFTDRAKRGDFAQAPVVPRRNEMISGS